MFLQIQQVLYILDMQEVRLQVIHLARVGKHLGYDITTEYYINDAGAQMDLLGLSVSLQQEILF